MTTKAVNPPPADLITVGTVPRNYPISSRTVFRRLQAGQLTRYRISGDMATYVSRAELDALMAPRAVD